MANMFDMSAAFAAKASTSTRIEPGVHNASFVKIEHGTQNTKNGPSEVMTLTINVENHGEYSQNFFKPNSTERTDGMYGPNPSQMEHFQIILREILEAVNPDFMKDIEAGNLKLAGNFKQIVNAVAAYTAQFVGTEFKVKFLPNGDFANIPSYPAAIARDGKTLRIANVFIGKNVTLSAAEERKIKAAAVAKPTEMAASKATSTEDLLGGMASDMGITTESDDITSDLPF